MNLSKIAFIDRRTFPRCEEKKMTESEQDKAIRNLASALDRLQNDNFDLRCCLGATFAASALMIFFGRLVRRR